MATPVIYYHTSGNAPASATTPIVAAAPAGYKVCVHAYAEHCGGTATTVRWYSAATPISGDHANLANVGRVCGWNPQAWFETSDGEALNLTAGAGSATGYEITYSIQPKDL